MPHWAPYQDALTQLAIGPEVFDIVAGRKEIEGYGEKWRYWRDPMPSPLDAKAHAFEWVRQDLGLASTDSQAP